VKPFVLPASAQPAADSFQLSIQQFRHLTALIKRNFGIHLPEEKRIMLSMRMQKMMRVARYDDFDGYFRDYLAQPSQETLIDLVDHVSTNHTHFWREPEHFVYYRDQILPQIIEQRRRKRKPDLRVWCAAASTGEEPYTIAMLQREVLGHLVAQWRAGLLATDISKSALVRARRGRYAADNASRLPQGLLRRYLQATSDGRYDIIESLKADVMYRPLNLIQASLPLRGNFDVIFCRNVMIYFEESTKRTLVEQMYQQLQPGGHLFIGHAETLNNLGSRFTFIKPGLYRKG